MKKRKLRAVEWIGIALMALMSQGMSSQMLVCSGSQKSALESEFIPEAITARDAAAIARECKDRNPPPEAAVAENAAQAAKAADDAASKLIGAIQRVSNAYKSKEMATYRRVRLQNQVPDSLARIDSLNQLANMAMAESGVDHNILYMHSLGLPPTYSTPTPGVKYSGWTNANHRLVRAAARAASRGQSMAQAAYDKAIVDTNATAAEVADFSTWLARADSLAASVDNRNTQAEELGYGTSDELTQLAVREAYWAMSLGYTARAKKTEIDLRGSHAHQVQEAAEEESEAIQAYQAALTYVQNAETAAANAADAAYAAALACGVDTKPIVPGSSEWNETFWEISSP